MYKILVFYPDKSSLAATLSASNGEELLALIPKTLGDHEGCERLTVTLGDARLFSVDCEGNRLP